MREIALIETVCRKARLEWSTVVPNRLLNASMYAAFVTFVFPVCCFFLNLETMASWQLCRDYTTQPVLDCLNLVQSPGVWRTDSLSQQNKEKGTAKALSLQHITSHLPAVLRPSGI